MISSHCTGEYLTNLAAGIPTEYRTTTVFRLASLGLPFLVLHTNVAVVTYHKPDCSEFPQTENARVGRLSAFVLSLAVNLPRQIPW